MNAEKFFDEIKKYGMSQSRIDSRKKVYRELRKGIDDCFEIILLDMINGGWLTEHDTSYYEDLLRAEYIRAAGSITDVSEETFSRHTHLFVEEIIQSIVTKWNTAKPDDENGDFQIARNLTSSGAEAGMPLSRDEIPDEIIAALGDERSQFISSDQSLYINGHGEYTELVKSGATTKTWHTMEDEFVRPTHVALDEVTIPIDEYFISGASRLLFPRDTSQDPGPGEVILCRCFL